MPEALAFGRQFIAQNPRFSVISCRTDNISGTRSGSCPTNQQRIILRETTARMTDINSVITDNRRINQHLRRIITMIGPSAYSRGRKIGWV
ncbi:hypothetical protein ACE1CD_31665 [Aerosakkonema sp. BLCC-F183]|uniref:hypothetical protein n=1 Tax=Aerosakkonema sp. BLCC-F183 TaxID=3342834 RepID=UPI0035BB2F27